MPDAYTAHPTRPELSFPSREAAYLKLAYNEARVILEYGSGGSTVLASEMSDKLIFSVESDWRWAIRVQSYIDAGNLPSPATVHHANIGPTGTWGRPLDNTHWSKFYNYPLSIWEKPFFRHPDLVLIDGRFRAACMMTVMARITQPVTVLFDDYTERLPYHVVEDWLKPRETIGRMAVFDVLPGLLGRKALCEINKALEQATYSTKEPFYEMQATDAVEQRRKNSKDHG
ncbi:conserved hypothetical protein [Roseovarius sp. EC-HK134]|uniref:hypothetical protein n=1 Tax=unclassified Roseovarius TaxID=2614913 RepID=UPI001258AED8|nr:MULTISPECIES: hypothetical protein [unclassified Roseovarius]VVS96338.1 conserved hypothetical protein [Roseovarius sp. EC-SD190]VVT34137.1 conserved hypothetical protein [Roseovarius sp. EC-HK134]